MINNKILQHSLCVNKIPLFDNITRVRVFKILITDCVDNEQLLVTSYYIMRMLRVLKIQV